jgi:hypothetical protein
MSHSATPPISPSSPVGNSRLHWSLVALTGWLVPGLGHALVGQCRRGAVAGGTLATVFLLGLLIGGIDAVDRRNDTLWFAGQALFGPAAFIADIVHQSLDTRRETQIARYARQHGLTREAALGRMIRTGEPLAYRTALGRVNEIGTLYCAIAGVMNLLVILDAVGRASAGHSFKPSRSKFERDASGEQR